MKKIFAGRDVLPSDLAGDRVTWVGPIARSHQRQVVSTAPVNYRTDTANGTVENQLEWRGTERISLLHLPERSSHGLNLLGKDLLDADVCALGTDRIRGDREALEDLIRICTKQRSVLERRRLTFGAVADGEPGTGPGGGFDGNNDGIGCES